MKSTSHISLPSELSFRFDTFLNNIPQGFSKEKQNTDSFENSEKLFYLLGDFLSDLSSVFPIEFKDEFIFSKEHRNHTPHEFPMDSYFLDAKNELFNYQVKLIREFNGHMGYYEDDINAEFIYGDKKCVLSCYLFISNEMKIVSENIDQEEHNRIIKSFQKKINE